jgi:ParB/RepB/Spo0J family partition protein
MRADDGTPNGRRSGTRKPSADQTRERFLQPSDVRAPIPSLDPRNQGAVQRVPVDRIHPAPWQPRRWFDPQGIEALAASIAERLINPLPGRPRRDGNGAWNGIDYELITGERRLRAGRLNAERDPERHGTIAVQVMEVDDVEAHLMAIRENTDRESQRPWETAIGYRNLRDALTAAEGTVVGSRRIAERAAGDERAAHRHMSVSYYLRIADALTEDHFRDAGFVSPDGSLDYARICKLSRGRLLKAAQEPTPEKRTERLREFGSPARSRASETITEKSANPLVRPAAGGELLIAAPRVLERAMPEAAREALERLVPALGALARAQGAMATAVQMEGGAVIVASDIDALRAIAGNRSMADWLVETITKAGRPAADRSDG